MVPMRAALAALLLAAAAPAAIAWEPDAAMLALYDKAKAEKEVVLAGPVATEIEWVQDYLARRFPGIAVSTVPDLQAATKIIAEARAGRHSIDVWTNSLGGMIEVEKRGLLARTDWQAYGLEPGNIEFDGDAIASHNFIFTVVYAKDHVAGSDVPRTWAALADARWTGKLTAQNFLLPRLMGFLALDWGPERAEAWGRTLIDERKLLVTNTPAANLLKTGERVVAVGDSISLAYQYSASGVSAGYKIMDLMPAAQFVVAVLKDAPHPNAAALVAAWLASDEGRGLYETVLHEADIRPGAKSELAHEIKDAGAKVILEDVATMDRRAEYYKSFSALVRGEQ